MKNVVHNKVNDKLSTHIDRRANYPVISEQHEIQNRNKDFRVLTFHGIPHIQPARLGDVC